MESTESIIVLRVRIHVIYGSRLCSGFLGRPSHFYQRACKWLIRRGCIHDCQLPDRNSVSMSVALLKVVNFWLDLLTSRSSNLSPILDCDIFPHQPPAWRKRFLHLGDVAVSGPSSWRILGGTDVVDIPELRNITRIDSIRQWPLDERWRCGNSSAFSSLKSNADSETYSGFLVPRTILNPFWEYVFHYIDYVSRFLSSLSPGI